MTESEIQNKYTESYLCLTYFSNPECNVCKTLRPKIEALVSEYPNIAFQYINTKIYPHLAGQNMIFAVPTILLFHRGVEVQRWSRYLSMQEIEMELERYQKTTNGQ